MAVSFPKIIKYTMLLVFIGVVVYLVNILVRRGGSQPTKAKPENRQLNPTLTMISNDFRHVQNENGVDRWTLVAKKDTAFADGRHELEDVQLDSKTQDGKPSGTLTARTCFYDQQDAKVVFKENVVITTADGLVVKTDALAFDQATNIATTESPVAFERKNVTGTCVGARLDSKGGLFVMEKDVHVNVLPEGETAAQPSGAEVKEKPAAASAKTAVITGDHAEYHKADQQVFLTGRARLERGGDTLQADRMVAFLDDKNKLKRIETRSNSVLASEVQQGRVESRDMDFTFTPAGDIDRAIATGNPRAVNLSDGTEREVTADTLDVTFVKGVAGQEVSQVTALGNARVRLPAAAPSPQAKQPAEKLLVAQTIRLNLAPGGKFAREAAAEGDAVLTVTPTVVAPRADRKTIRAPRMDAAFFEGDNQLRDFTASGGVTVELAPLEPNTTRAVRTTRSDRAAANFDRATRDVAEVTQEGGFTYKEGVKNATADRAVYTQARDLVQLRGARPTVWDDKARTQADEIDLFVETSENVARGQVRTTYYSPKSAGNATPFARTSSPVFVTAETATANSKTGYAVFRGNARGWQDDNFVRGDTIELFQTDKRMVATGNVSSALYQVERADDKGNKRVVPMFGTSEVLTYSDTERFAHYERNVKLVQGEDTLTAADTVIYLQAGKNEVDRIVATGKVVVVQPNRRGTGDRAEYTAANERFEITGNVARVEDSERGTTTGPRLTFTRSDGSVAARDQNRTQRIRTRHRVER